MTEKKDTSRFQSKVRVGMFDSSVKKTPDPLAEMTPDELKKKQTKLQQDIKQLEKDLHDFEVAFTYLGHRLEKRVNQLQEAQAEHAKTPTAEIKERIQKVTEAKKKLEKAVVDLKADDHRKMMNDSINFLKKKLGEVEVKLKTT